MILSSRKVGILATMIAIAGCAKKDKYVTNGSFTGCYFNGSSLIYLAKDGKASYDRTYNFDYRVINPVAGKHGYILEVSVVATRILQNKLAFDVSNHSFWPIDTTKAIKVVVKTGTEVIFAKSNC